MTNVNFLVLMMYCGSVRFTVREGTQELSTVWQFLIRLKLFQNKRFFRKFISAAYPLLQHLPNASNRTPHPQSCWICFSPGLGALEGAVTFSPVLPGPAQGLARSWCSQMSIDPSGPEYQNKQPLLLGAVSENIF